MKTIPTVVAVIISAYAGFYSGFHVGKQDAAVAIEESRESIKMLSQRIKATMETILSAKEFAGYANGRAYVFKRYNQDADYEAWARWIESAQKIRSNP